MDKRLNYSTYKNLRRKTNIVDDDTRESVFVYFSGPKDKRLVRRLEKDVVDGRHR